jgi:hypothetical protein
MPIVTYDDLVAPSQSDPTKSVAELCLERMQDPKYPMPPAPATPSTAADVAVIQAWIDAGKPSTCDEGAAGAAGAGPVVENPYDTPTVCTSTKTWTRGNQESPNMHPGGACIQCHTSGGGEENGPSFTFAGTVYPTAHEPDDCNGLDGTTEGAQVVVVDASGATFTMDVNTVGNFYYEARTAVAFPYQAKVVQGGRERAMIHEQDSGDCNHCHTETGDKDVPGRIMAP